MFTALSTTRKQLPQSDGLRSVNLRTDLGELADLIELVFADSMDENGRAAIREMRYLSHLGAGLALVGRLNEMMLGISMGYVWIEGGKLVGNVSIYPARWSRNVGEAWMIANVGVHPDYRGRGIARQLMQASIDTIRRKGATHAILQVDYENVPAITLYESLDFVRERAFTVWTRSPFLGAPSLRQTEHLHITHPRRSEWQAEYSLAQELRPNERGGLGWLKPLEEGLFRPSIMRQLQALVSLNTHERLIIRSEDEQRILASVWVERGFSLARTRLMLMAQPDHLIPEAEAILHLVLRRFQTTGFVLEHPQDDFEASDLFRHLRFMPARTVWHMRCDL